MRREILFATGGAVLLALGGALVVGFALWNFSATVYPVYLGAGSSFALALLFFAAARDARRYRQEYLRAVEDGHPLPEGGPPR